MHRPPWSPAHHEGLPPRRSAVRGGGPSPSVTTSTARRRTATRQRASPRRRRSRRAGGGSSSKTGEIRFRGQTGKHWPKLSLTASESEAPEGGGSNQHPAPP